MSQHSLLAQWLHRVGPGNLHGGKCPSKTQWFSEIQQFHGIKYKYNGIQKNIQAFPSLFFAFPLILCCLTLQIKLRNIYRNLLYASQKLSHVLSSSSLSSNWLQQELPPCLIPAPSAVHQPKKKEWIRMIPLCFPQDFFLKGILSPGFHPPN